MRSKFLSALAVTATAAAGLVVLVVVSGTAHADVTSSGGDYVQLASAGELADTRNGYGVAKAPMTAADTLAVPVLGHGGVPSTGVSAVQVSLVGYAPTASTWLSAFPDGTAFDHATSALNIPAATTELSDTAVVQVGTDGKIALYNAAGTINVVVAVLGYYTSTTAASGPGGFTPTYYNRILDTRSGLGATKAQIAAGKSVTVTVTSGSVPTTASSVYLDVIVTGATKAGYIADYPYGSPASAMTVLAFGPGTTGHELSVKPGTSGRVTFVNTSGAAIDLVATQEGFTSSTSTTGSGLHVARQRLISSTSVAANGTLVVPIVGHAGVPTSHVTGAVLSLAAYGATVGGYLKAWGTGNTEPGASALDFPAKATRAGLAVVGVNSNGSVTIRNDASTAVTVYVDLEGWFSDQHNDAAPVAFAATSALQLPASGTAPGAIEYAYVDNIGQLHTGFQASPDDFLTVSWKTVSGIGDIFTGQPTLNLQADNSIAVSAEYRDTGVRTTTEPSASAAAQTWSPFFDTGGSFPAAPATAALGTSGTLYSFAVDTAGALWIRAAGTTTSWVARSTTPALVGTPTVVTTGTGIQVFALTTAGTVVTASYAGGAALSAWTDLGGTGVVDRPAVAIRPGYLMQVVIRQGDGTIATKAQATNGSYPTSWTPVGTFASVGAPATVLDPVSGTIEILARSAADGCIYNSGETVQGSQTWRDWVMASNGEQSATDPTITTFTGASNGDGWLAPFRTPQNGTRVITRQLSGSPAFAARHPQFTTRAIATPTR